MKKLIFITLMMVISLSVQAQQRPQQRPHMDQERRIERDSTKGPERREKIESFQLKQIEEVLKLKGNKLEKFRALYKEYTEATKKSGPKHKFTSDITLSDKELEAKITGAFAESKRSIEIQEEFYARFREILSVREVAAMYEVERRIRERAFYEMKNRAEKPKAPQQRPQQQPRK